LVRIEQIKRIILMGELFDLHDSINVIGSLPLGEWLGLYGMHKGSGKVSFARPGELATPVIGAELSLFVAPERRRDRLQRQGARLRQGQLKDQAVKEPTKKEGKA
jgi:hypothetical protein